MLAFGGSRTFHRIACAIEDAGFEIRDTIMWLYGSGFPKSMALDKALESKLTTGNANKTEFHKLKGVKADKHNYGFTAINKQQGVRPKNYTTEGASKQYLKELDATAELAIKYKGWGTCLKPSFEPIIVARKPFKGSLVDNVIKYGVGGLNIDECKVGNEKRVQQQAGYIRIGRTDEEVFMGVDSNKPTEPYGIVNGRFPANTILTYDENDYDEVCGGFPYTKSTGGSGEASKKATFANVYGEYKHNYVSNSLGGLGDSGSASRYFYCAKASKKDRSEGLDDFDIKITGELQSGRKEGIAGSLGVRDDGSIGVNSYAGNGSPKKNMHPTVKPTELMQYLIRLVTPNGGVILDPFMGSGSTGKAAMYENKERNKNYSFIGIEVEQEYYKVAEVRIKYVINHKQDIKEVNTGLQQNSDIKNSNIRGFLF